MVVILSFIFKNVDEVKERSRSQDGTGTTRHTRSEVQKKAR
jgi:hypothetical protein